MVDKFYHVWDFSNIQLNFHVNLAIDHRINHKKQFTERQLFFLVYFASVLTHQFSWTYLYCAKDYSIKPKIDYHYSKQNIEYRIQHTSQPSKPKATASSVNRSAYMKAESFVDSSLLARITPSSHSMIKVPSTLC